MVVTELDRVREYISDICSHVKFREAHQEIKIELQTHLEYSVEKYLSEGFTEKEAVSKAIGQMGSANIIGSQLNEVHKPKQEWSILALSIVFVSVGLFTMYYIEKQGLTTVLPIPLFGSSLFFAIIGSVVVIGLYLFDYRKMQSYSKYIYIGTALALAFVIAFGQDFEGKAYLSIGPISLDFIEICPILFAMALAGILKKWDWKKPKVLLYNLLLCLFPLLLILKSGSMSAIVIYAITCIILMIVCWKRPNKLLLLLGLVSGVMVLISKSNNQPELYGHGFKPELMAGAHTYFIFSYINFSFGWIVACVLTALAVMLIIRLSHIIIVVKDNYGKRLSSGLVTTFVVQFLWNILMNLGFSPISTVGFPFISFGGSQLLFSAVALGIILSIYKQKNILTNLSN